jgi:nitroreductase
MDTSEGSAFMRLVHARRSIREYRPTSVDRELVLSCIEAAVVAPSSMNKQPWRFVVLDRREDIDRLVERTCTGPYRPTKWIAAAPVVVAIVIAGDFITHRLGRLLQGTAFHLLDAGIAGEHLILRATELGLGTCWVGWFNARGASRALRVPRGHRVVALVPMGWPDPGYVVGERTVRAVEEVTKFGGWEDLATSA